MWHPADPQVVSPVRRRACRRHPGAPPHAGERAQGPHHEGDILQGPRASVRAGTPPRPEISGDQGSDGRAEESFRKGCQASLCMVGLVYLFVCHVI